MNKKTAKAVMRELKRVDLHGVGFGEEVVVVVKKEKSRKKNERRDKR